MKFKFALASLFALSLALACRNAVFADSAPVQLRLQTPENATPSQQKPPDAAIGGFAAPGADAVMTPDMLLVTPSNEAQEKPPPLKDLIGSALKMHIDRGDIEFDKLRGVMITVTNDANRPVVVDGDKAIASVAGTKYTCVPVSTIQQLIIPPRHRNQKFEEILTKAVPAAVTVGAAPTVRDIRNSRKPVLQRYGPDELRRQIEYSRFGRRILWSGQKAQGILYFQAESELQGESVVIPATTLFDAQDTATLTSSP